MPIYEYECSACQHEFEALQKMSDAPLEECPQCGERALNKKVSAAAFRLSGSGWYETDFKSGKKKNLAGDAGSSGKASKAESATSGSSGNGGNNSSKSADKSSSSKASSATKNT